MILSWLVATVHLLALPLGLGSIWGRARALRGTLDHAGRARVFVADTWWGVAAAIWIATGLYRAFGGLGKGTGYYLHAHAFHAKMGLLALTLILEIWPMVTLIRWRIATGRGDAVDTGAAPGLALISDLQTALVVLMVFAATAMARGLFA